MSTPVSTSVAYCTPAQYLTFCDARRTGNLCSDNQVTVPPSQLPTNANLLAALQRASGMVEASCLKGARYSPADLANLTQAADVTAGKLSNSQQFLIGLVADLAYGILHERRGWAKEGVVLPQVERAWVVLKELEEGKEVFALQEAMNAGNPPNPYFMQPADFTKRNFSSNQAANYFGERAQQFVPGQT